jgi:hypothetical protein
LYSIRPQGELVWPVQSFYNWDDFSFDEATTSIEVMIRNIFTKSTTRDSRPILPEIGCEQNHLCPHGSITNSPKGAKLRQNADLISGEKVT